MSVWDFVSGLVIGLFIIILCFVSFGSLGEPQRPEPTILTEVG
jgi:hypothetical protein